MPQFVIYNLCIGQVGIQTTRMNSTDHQWRGKNQDALKEMIMVDVKFSYANMKTIIIAHTLILITFCMGYVNLIDLTEIPDDISEQSEIDDLPPAAINPTATLDRLVT